jgi:hypothetical protein
MAGLAALREAEIQVPLMERGGRISECVAACAIRNCLKRIGIGRPDRKGSDHQKTEQHRPISAITNPDTVIHASTPPGYDFFPGHRPPPIFQTKILSFLNEPLVNGRTQGGTPSAAESSYFNFAGMNFDNVILIAPLLFRDFPRKTTEPFDIT